MASQVVRVVGFPVNCRFVAPRIRTCDRHNSRSISMGLHRGIGNRARRFRSPWIWARRHITTARGGCFGRREAHHRGHPSRDPLCRCGRGLCIDSSAHEPRRSHPARTWCSNDVEEHHGGGKGSTSGLRTYKRTSGERDVIGAGAVTDSQAPLNSSSRYVRIRFSAALESSVFRIALSP